MIIPAVGKFTSDNSDLTLGKFTNDNSDLTLGKFTHIKFILVDGKFIIWGPGKFTQIWIVPRMFHQ